MDFIREVFSIPFGYLIGFFYELSDNYILSLLLMTICVKLVLLPSSIKQQKGMVKTQRMQPKIKRIREKYAGNQQKMNEAMNELYAKEGYSSMTGGCSGLLIQFPIMMGVYFVNYKILDYVLRVPEDVLNVIKDAVRALPEDVIGKVSNLEYQIELLAIQHLDKLDLTGVPVEFIEKIQLFKDNFTLFGIDLSRTPSTDMGWDLLWLIPILTGVTSLMMGVYTWLRQKKTNPEMAKNPAMGCMSFMSPAMSLIFTFMFPTGVGVYWIISNIIAFVQQVGLSIFYSPKKVIAQQMVDETVVRRSKENTTKLRVENEKK